ncbi:MAG: hypothetical protein COA58_07860 [Bacteroidetes bacterium]|nr:MAG: hypothetical protein COA58_07860 [Bacteroidota bacterium]
MDHFEDFKDTETLVERPNRFQALLHLILGFLFFIGSLFILGSLAVIICSYLISGTTIDLSAMMDLLNDLKSHPFVLKLFIFISSSLPMIVASLLTLIFIKATAKDYLLLNFPKSMKWFLLSMVFVFISIPLMGVMLEVNKLIDFSQWPDFHKWLITQENTNNGIYEAMVGDKGAMSFLSSILFMALVPALVEEIFFRGFLMNAFNGLFKNMHIAIFITAIIFSLIHMQFMKIIPMFFLAIVFGYAAYWTGTIWTSIIAHFINNTLAVIQLYYLTDGSYEEALEQSSKIAPALNIVFGIGVIVLFYYLQRNSTTKTQNFYV